MTPPSTSPLDRAQIARQNHHRTRSLAGLVGYLAVLVVLVGVATAPVTTTVAVVVVGFVLVAIRGTRRRRHAGFRSTGDLPAESSRRRPTRR